MRRRTAFRSSARRRVSPACRPRWPTALRLLPRGASPPAARDRRRRQGSRPLRSQGGAPAPVIRSRAPVMGPTAPVIRSRTPVVSGFSRTLLTVALTLWAASLPLVAQQADRTRTEALVERATDRMRAPEREADPLAAQERTPPR